jgi:hypothetical protein
MEHKQPPEETASGNASESDNRREFLKKLSYIAPAIITYQVDDALAKKKKKKKKKKTSPTPDTVPLPPP